MILTMLQLPRASPRLSEVLSGLKILSKPSPTLTLPPRGDMHAHNLNFIKTLMDIPIYDKVVLKSFAFELSILIGVHPAKSLIALTKCNHGTIL